MDQIAVMVIFIGIPVALGAIYRSHLAHARFMKVLQLRAEANAKLMDRFGQDPALLEYLRSDANRELLDVRIQDTSTSVPGGYGRMLTSIQLGLVFLSGGVAVAWFSRYVTWPRDQQGFLMVGTLGAALGIGALLSAVASHFVIKLAKREEGHETR